MGDRAMMGRRIAATLLAAAGAVIPIAVARADADAVTIHVAAEGDDGWSGRQPMPNADRTDGPLATPAAARDAVRRLKAAGGRPREVVIHPGRYELSEPLRLTAEDGGTAERPMVWRARGRAVLSGGRRIGDFVPVADESVLARLPEAARGAVLQADLTAAGVTDAGTFAGAGERIEVFHDDRPLPIARWPNEGFAVIGALLGDRPITDGGLPGNAVGKFTCETDRLPAWQAEADGWLAGYFFWDWSDSRQRIRAVDPATRSIELEPPHTTYRSGQRFHAFNMLCELDRPGEWCVDRDRGILYVWPPDEGRPLAVTVTHLPHLVVGAGAEHVVLRGLLLEGTRNSLVTITGGGGVTVGGCRLRNAGGWGVWIEGGAGHAVRGCDIHEVGEGGVMLSGGDRPTLAAAGHVAENNHVHHYARLQRTYRPAVEVRGVGSRVLHNHIHDAPHNGILLNGNDHLVEGNRIHHVCQETGDVGGFYMGRDWTMRGTIVRHNLFADLAGPGRLGAMGVYLDDCASGITVVGNVFVRACREVLIGGGRDNLVENNLFIDGEPAVEIDARGLGWFAATVASGGWMRQRLDEMPWRTPPWTGRYPGLATLLDDQPEAPRRNVVRRNVSVGGTWMRIEPAAAVGVVVEDNLVGVDPRFVDAPRGDYRLRDDSPAWAIGFRPIPFDRIGMVADAWRRWIPDE